MPRRCSMSVFRAFPSATPNAIDARSHPIPTDGWLTSNYDRGQTMRSLKIENEQDLNRLNAFFESLSALAGEFEFRSPRQRARPFHASAAALPSEAHFQAASRRSAQRPHGRYVQSLSGLACCCLVERLSKLE